MPVPNGSRIEWSPPVRGVKVRSGAAFDVPVGLRNPDSKPIPLAPFKVLVTALGSRCVVANRAAPTGYNDVAEFLNAGATQSAHVLGGTDACDAARGWALPPGRYSLFVVSASPLPDGTVFVSPPIALAVTR